MSKLYIGIDNGVTGSIGMVMDDEEPYLSSTPVRLQQDYTKKKKNINRLDPMEFRNIITITGLLSDYSQKIAVIERPLVNPRMFHATMSAVRCMESQLCMLEASGIPYMFIDSKQWQKELLPQGCKREELKKASLDIGIRLFPSLEDEIRKQKDADGLLIAEWARRHNL